MSEQLTNKEALDYLLSTGLYEKGTEKHPYSHLYAEERMLNETGYISVSELTKRLIEIDKYYNGESWNIRQILSNINLIIPEER